jgi:pimeloyl-ACP methyl ester carboxylesterase
MDAVGSERAAVFGNSEGGFMSAMFAATNPERTAALIMQGSYARESWARGRTAEQYFKTWHTDLEKSWGEPFQLDEAAPSMADDEAAQSWFGAYLRNSASFSAAKALADWNFEVDIRGILPSIRVPTLVLHRRDDRWYSVAEAQYLVDRNMHSRMNWMK